MSLIVKATSREVFNVFLLDNCVLDCRPPAEFEANSIHNSQNWIVGVPGTQQGLYLDSYLNCLVVYSDRTLELDEQIVHEITEYAKSACKRVERIFLLEGGFSAFQSAYPFACTASPLYSQALLFPQEIWPNLFLCSEFIAENPIIREALKVTHVLSTAAECRNPFSDEEKLRRTWRGLTWTDELNDIIYQDFPSVIDWIDNALSSGGVVLVHCHRGVSRSAAAIVAWLIAKQQMEVTAAHELVRSRRQVVNVNENYLHQLYQYQLKLRK